MAVRTQDFEFAEFGTEGYQADVRVEWARWRDDEVFLHVERNAAKSISLYLTAEQAKELGYALLYVAGEGSDDAD